MVTIPERMWPFSFFPYLQIENMMLQYSMNDYESGAQSPGNDRTLWDESVIFLFTPFHSQATIQDETLCPVSIF